MSKLRGRRAIAAPRPRLQSRSISQRNWLMLGGAFAAFTVSAGMMHSYAVFLVAFIQAFGGAAPRPRLPIRSRSSSPAAVRRWSERWSTGSDRGACCWSAAACSSWDCSAAPLLGALADRRPLRRGDDVRRQLPRAGGFRAVRCRADFVRHRGMAISIVQSANGFARALSAPVVQLLISGVGWRHTYCHPGGLHGGGGLCRSRPGSARGGASRPPAEPGATAGVAIGCRTAGRAAARPLDPCRGDAHAAFLAACSRSICSPGWAAFFVSLHQLAFAVDRGFDKLYAAGCSAWALSRDLRHDLHRHAVRLYRTRACRRSSPMAYRSSASSARCSSPGPDQGWLLWLLCLLFRSDLGRARPGDHRQDRRSVSRRAIGTILGVITIGSGHRLRRRLVGGRVDLRPVRQLRIGLHPVDRFLSLRLRRVLGIAAPADAPVRRAPEGGDDRLMHRRRAAATAGAEAVATRRPSRQFAVADQFRSNQLRLDLPM